nr:ZIP family metal transporter [Actinopolyspora biskrensis]
MGDMTLTATRERPRNGERAVAVGVLSVFVGVCVAAETAGLGKLLIIAVVSCLAMVAGAALALRRIVNSSTLTWAYGLAAGAMVASACAFLLPTAIERDATLGGFGIAAGVLAGFTVHLAGAGFGPRTALLDDYVVRLTVHSVAAGFVIGAIYASMPNIGLLLGLSIISHKGPAGYAAALSLHRSGRSIVPVILPACGIGIAAIAVGLLGWPLSPTVTAPVFGVAAGLFLHVALDFLAHLEKSRAAGSPLLAAHATTSALAGAATVVCAWAITGA